MSYPGLETEYVIHEASWKARAHALQQVPGRLAMQAEGPNSLVQGCPFEALWKD